MESDKMSYKDALLKHRYFEKLDSPEQPRGYLENFAQPDNEHELQDFYNGGLWPKRRQLFAIKRKEVCPKLRQYSPEKDIDRLRNHCRVTDSWSNGDVFISSPDYRTRESDQIEDYEYSLREQDNTLYYVGNRNQRFNKRKNYKYSFNAITVTEVTYCCKGVLVTSNLKSDLVQKYQSSFSCSHEQAIEEIVKIFAMEFVLKKGLANMSVKSIPDYLRNIWYSQYQKCRNAKTGSHLSKRLFICRNWYSIATHLSFDCFLEDKWGIDWFSLAVNEVQRRFGKGPLVADSQMESWQLIEMMVKFATDHKNTWDFMCDLLKEGGTVLQWFRTKMTNIMTMMGFEAAPANALLAKIVMGLVVAGVLGGLIYVSSLAVKTIVSIASNLLAMLYGKTPLCRMEIAVSQMAECQSGSFISFIATVCSMICWYLFGNTTNFVGITTGSVHLGRMAENFADIIQPYFGKLVEMATGVNLFGDKSFEFVLSTIQEISEFVHRDNIEALVVKDVQVAQECRALFTKHVGFKQVLVKLSPSTKINTGVIMSDLSRLEMLRDRAATCGDHIHNRMEPICVYLLGGPNQGKSSLMKWIMVSLYQLLRKDFRFNSQSNLQAPEFTDSMVYPRKAGQEYWEGYAGQMFVTYNDMFAERSADIRVLTAAEIIDAIDRCAWMLNMAFNLKGRQYFESEIVICTSNESEFSNIGLAQPSAFKRRLHFPITVVRKEELLLDGSNYKTAWELSVSHSSDGWLGLSKHLPDKKTFDLSELVLAMYMEYVDRKLAKTHKDIAKNIDWTQEVGPSYFENLRKLNPLNDEEIVIQGSRYPQDIERYKKGLVLPAEKVHEDYQDVYRTSEEMETTDKYLVVGEELIYSDGKNITRMAPHIWARMYQLALQNQKFVYHSYPDLMPKYTLFRDVMTELEREFVLEQEGFSKLQMEMKARRRVKGKDKDKAESQMFGSRWWKPVEKDDLIAHDYNDYVLVASNWSIETRFRFLRGEDEFQNCGSRTRWLRDMSEFNFKYPEIWQMVALVTNSLVPEVIHEVEKEYSESALEAHLFVKTKIRKMSQEDWDRFIPEHRHVPFNVQETIILSNIRSLEHPILSMDLNTIYRTYQNEFLLCFMYRMAAERYKRIQRYITQLYMYNYHGLMKLIAPFDPAKVVKKRTSFEAVYDWMRERCAVLVGMEYAGIFLTCVLCGGVAVCLGTLCSTIFAGSQKMRSVGHEMYDLDSNEFKAMTDKVESQSVGSKKYSTALKSRNERRLISKQTIQKASDSSDAMKIAEYQSFGDQLLDRAKKVLDNMRLTVFRNRSGQTIETNVLFVDNRTILVPGHAFYAIDFTSFTVYDDQLKGQVIYTRSEFDAEKLINRDLVKITLSKCVPHPYISKIISMFPLKPIPQSSKGVIRLSKVESETDKILDRVYQQYERWVYMDSSLDAAATLEDGIKVKSTMMGFYTVVNGGGIPGMCSSPYLALDPALGAHPLIGVHIARLGADSIIAPVFQSDFATLGNSSLIADAQCFDFSTFKAGPEGTEAFAFVKSEYKSFYSEKTAYVPSPIYDFIETDVAPACLDKEVYKNFYNNYKLYPPVPKPQILTDLEQDPQELFGLLGSPSSDFKYRSLTIEQACFGDPELEIDSLDRNTASGLFYKEQGKGKRGDFFEIRDGVPWIDPEFRQAVKQRWDEMLRGDCRSQNVKDHAKDELRTRARVLAKKSRIFGVGALVDCVVVKMALYWPLQYLKKHRYNHGVAIGSNVHDYDWYYLFQRIFKFCPEKRDLVIGGDLKTMDISTQRFMAYSMYLFFVYFMPIAMRIPAIQNLIMGCCFLVVSTVHVGPFGAYFYSRGNSSGNWLTGFFNSVCICVYLCCSFYYLRPAGCERKFSTSFSGVVNGDDNLGSVHPDVAGWFNCLTIPKALKELFGVELTAPDKGEFKTPFLPEKDQVFLARRFVWLKGKLTAQLEWDSIFGSLKWLRKHEELTLEQSLAQNIEVALLESVHYDEEKRKEIHRIIETALDKAGVQISYKPYEYWENARMNAYSDNFSYNSGI